MRGVKRDGISSKTSIPRMAKRPTRVSMGEGSRRNVVSRGRVSLSERDKEIHVRSMTGRKNVSTGKTTCDMHVARSAQRGRQTWNGSRSMGLGPEGKWSCRICRARARSRMLNGISPATG